MQYIEETTMINELNNTNNQIIGVIIIYVVLSLLLIRSVSKHKDKDIPHIHNEYTKRTDLEEGSKYSEQYDHEITSYNCVICQRIDVIHIDKDKLEELCKQSNIDVGRYLIEHEKSSSLPHHHVIHFMSSIGEYIGNEIPYNDLQKVADSRPLLETT